MSKTKTEEWIKAGYELFSNEGIESLKVERLARSLELNKSGFYHYFGSMNTYLKYLMEYHINKAKDLTEEIAGCQNIDPDLLHLIIRHKSFFLIESQLLVKCRPAQFGEDIGIGKAASIVTLKLLPLWRKFTLLPDDSSTATAYLNIILHFFYARINSDNINYEFLHALTFETQGVLKKVMKEKP
jgi:AcrR family transcriptional regulator